jgi:heat shock protein HslJ
MNRLIFYSLLITLIGSSCSVFRKSSNQDPKSEQITPIHNSRNSLDWGGTYRGIVPCADCPGIKTEIILYEDLSYSLSRQYIDKSDSVFTEKGNFNWNDAGSQITLNTPGGEPGGKSFFVGENTLFMLDASGDRVEGLLADKYKLTKIGSGIKITGKFWKLVELGGIEILSHDSLGRIPHLNLRTEENRVAGNTGCNAFTGSYELGEENQIRFSPLATTRMYCKEIEYEDEFMNLFDRAKSFKTIDDSLHLLDAENNLLGVFVWDFFRPVTEDL